MLHYAFKYGPSKPSPMPTDKYYFNHRKYHERSTHLALVLKAWADLMVERPFQKCTSYNITWHSLELLIISIISHRESTLAASFLTSWFKLRRHFTHTHIRLISFRSNLLYDFVKVPLGIIRIKLALMEHISDRN